MTAAQELPVGKRMYSRSAGRYQTTLSHPDAQTWRVLIAWPVMEGNDGDPLSVTCGCDFSGQAHAHMLRLYRTAAEAGAAYDLAREALRTSVPNRVATSLGITDATTDEAYADAPTRIVR